MGGADGWPFSVNTTSMHLLQCFTEDKDFPDSASRRPDEASKYERYITAKTCYCTLIPSFERGKAVQVVQERKSEVKGQICTQVKVGGPPTREIAYQRDLAPGPSGT